MDFLRLRDLMNLIRCRIQTNRMALVGGNHTAARFSDTWSWQRIWVGGARNTVGGFPDKPRTKMEFRSGRVVPNSDSLLVFKLLDSKTMRVLSRSVFVLTVILTLQCMGSILRGKSGSATDHHHPSSEFFNFDFLNLLCRDLVNEGLIMKGHRALVLSSGVATRDEEVHSLDDIEMASVTTSGLHWLDSLSDEKFDVIFIAGSVDSNFVNRILKVGGIVAMQLSGDILNAYPKQFSNYVIAYIRKYNSIVMAMKKTGRMSWPVSTTERRLMVLEGKTAALTGLEDVLLEPPRKAVLSPNIFLNKIKFLPDLIGDSLASYPRRMFVHVGLPQEKEDIIEWFHEMYPQRDRLFECYSLEVAPEGGGRTEQGIDVSDWLTENVKEGDYVVMKAEAEVVERMIHRKTVTLVDDLFLECDNQWQDSEGKKTERAYWHCLALYGRLRDEGIAVYQWWS